MNRCDGRWCSWPKRLGSRGEKPVCEWARAMSGHPFYWVEGRGGMRSRERNGRWWVFHSAATELKRRGRGNRGAVHRFGEGEEEQARGSDVSSWHGHGGIGRRGMARWRLAADSYSFIAFIQRRKKPRWARWTMWAGWAGWAEPEAWKRKGKEIKSELGYLEHLGWIQRFEILGCRIDFWIDSVIFGVQDKRFKCFQTKFELNSK
jgi:hypothetical protein